jgi:hypothetical protein
VSRIPMAADNPALEAQRTLTEDPLVCPAHLSLRTPEQP